MHVTFHGISSMTCFLKKKRPGGGIQLEYSCYSGSLDVGHCVGNCALDLLFRDSPGCWGAMFFLSLGCAQMDVLIKKGL